LVRAAENKKLASVVLSFKPSPAEYFGNAAVESVFTERERGEILRRHGIMIDEWVQIPFDETVAELSAEGFIEMLRREYNCARIVAGSDFRFGKDRAGGIDTLMDSTEIETVLIDIQLQDSSKISSNGIREAIALSDFAAAESMLGYNYFITGNVERGKGLGQKLGFPTANIIPIPQKTLPPDGVFLTKVSFNGKRLNGITNIGKSKVANEDNRLVETHIFDYTGEIYGREIHVEFLRKIRDMITFESLSALMNQVQADFKMAKDFFK
jgi:riboflavin kinase/FMN adenylyltransferase